jgi:hypothetical protein
MPLTSKMNYNIMKIFQATLVSLLLLCSSLLFAQRGDNIESLHTGFITEKLNLTNEESQKFWPIYDQYHADFEALKKERGENRKIIERAGGIDNMKDADVQKIIVSETDIQSRELELHKQYIVKFEQVIPARKVAKFFIAEEEFKIYLLKQLTNRRGGGMGRRNSDSEFVPQ